MPRLAIPYNMYDPSLHPHIKNICSGIQGSTKRNFTVTHLTLLQDLVAKHWSFVSGENNA
jgi:hypothetical protein